jgi:nucleotide-binding universal stress UspA family protein
MEKHPQEEVSLVELAVGYSLHWMQLANPGGVAHRRVLVPMDKTREAEGVVPIVQDLLARKGDVILLHVITPSSSGSAANESARPEAGPGEASCREAMEYLEGVVRRLGPAAHQWQCDVIFASSVADGIANYAAQEKVDLIAMYTHDRKGLAKLISASVAKKVQGRAQVEVMVFRPQELALT